MKVNIKDIKHIARLSKINFTDTELTTFLNEFNSIIAHFDNINNEDLSSINTENKKNQLSILRPDITNTFKDSKDLLTNSKTINKDYFQVPKIID